MSDDERIREQVNSEWNATVEQMEARIVELEADLRAQTRRDAELSEADRIAADFSTIPFPDHEARTLALAYFRLKAELEQARAALDPNRDTQQ
jgi:hypothetical protein